jgi:hypothetical protein
MISVNSCDVAVLECLRAARAMTPISLGLAVMCSRVLAKNGLHAGGPGPAQR